MWEREFVTWLTHSSGVSDDLEKRKLTRSYQQAEGTTNMAWSLVHSHLGKGSPNVQESRKTPVRKAVELLNPIWAWQRQELCAPWKQLEKAPWRVYSTWGGFNELNASVTCFCPQKQRKSLGPPGEW